jgi:signal transduction histidine kinase
MFLKKREIERLSADIRRAIDGKQTDFRDNREGVWSALKNDIYTLSNRLNEQADQLNLEKAGMSTALADISHQLKTPLTSALMMGELLENDGLPPDKRQEFLHSLQHSLAHTERLVLSLLKIARLDGGAVVFQREEVTANALINAAMLPLTVMLEARNQTATVPSADVSFTCDIVWTGEALTNIIKNAAEHAPEGGEIAITSGENLLYAWISVTDSGKGLTRDQLPSLFERFRSANKRGGIGIGLNMARTILRGQGGDIEATLPNTFTLKFYK